MNRYVIFGNGIAGQTCAEELRGQDADAQITVVAAESHPLYSRVALPRHLRGQIGEASIFLRKPESAAASNIDLLSSTRAVSVDPFSRTVAISTGADLPYDALLVATGGRPKPPPWPGAIPGGNILPFHTIDDTRVLIERSQTARRVLVLGGGFIGYELAEALNRWPGVEVVWVLRAPHFLASVLDEDAGEFCALLARAEGVQLLTGTRIDRLETCGSGCVAITGDDERLTFDFAAYGVGLDFSTECVVGSALAGARGIRTDSTLQTDIPGVYAAGDIAIFFDTLLGRYHQMGAWDSAQAQGRTAALNMASDHRDFRMVPLYSTTLFGSAIVIMGDVKTSHPKTKVEKRFCVESRIYHKLFFRDERLVGAIVIGPPKGRKKLVEMISEGTPCRLGDFDFLPSAGARGVVAATSSL